MKKIRILVIGGGSYIGGNLVKSLNQDYEVFCTFNNKQVDLQGLHAYHVNLTQPDPFKLLRNEEPFDIIVWTAQAEKYSQDLNSYKNLIDVNVSGLQKTLDFARDNRATRFIYLSSGSVYKKTSLPSAYDENAPIDLDSYYGFSKYIGEQMCHHYSTSTEMKFICLRLFTVYGPFQERKVIPNIWRAIKNNKNISLNSGVGMKFNAIYIDDLCKMIKKIINFDVKNRFEIYNLANPEILNLSDICCEIGKLEEVNLSLSENELPITYSLANIDKLTGIISDISFCSMQEGLLKIFNSRKQ